MRRFLSLAVVVATLFQGGRGVADPPGPLYQWSGETSMIAGATTYSRGEFVYNDFVFDDTGPSGRADDAAGLGVTAPQQASDTIGRGYAEYPHDWDRYGDNAADLVEVRVTADASNVYYLFRLNTLLEPDSTAVAIAVDQDGDESNSGGSWPFGANLSLPGWERVYTFWGTGGAITDAAGSSIDVREAGGGVRVDLEENVIEARIPRAVAEPGTGTWRVWGAAGLWDPGAMTWLPFAPVADEHYPGIRYLGAALAGRVPNVFNVAFRSMDETEDFGTDRQAAALTAGDISEFSAEVDFAKIAERASDPQGPPPVGAYTRVYRSGVPGEGIVDLQMRPCYETVSIDNQPRKHPTCQEFFLSRYQPYHVYVPASYRPDDPNPLVVTSHGANNYFGPDIEFVGGYGAIDRNGAVVVSTLARGQSTVYLRAAEQDTLEVIADAKDRYAVDDDRVSAVGASHAGGMVWIMTTLYPEVFSAGLPLIPGYVKHKEFGTENDVILNFAYVPLGPEGDRLQHVSFKVSDLFENLRNVPMRIVTGDQDPLSPPGRYELTVTDRLGELGYDYVHYGCSIRTHGGTSTTLGQELLDWLINQVRVRDPRFVVFKGNTGIDSWNAPWGNSHDDANWVRDMRVANPARPFIARAESEAIPDASRTQRPLSGAMAEPADAPPSVCHYKGLALDPAGPLEVSNALTMDLDNVSSLTVDADRARLSLAESPVLEISTNSGTDVTLSSSDVGVGSWIEADGYSFPSTVVGNSILFETLTGHHSYVVHVI